MVFGLDRAGIVDIAVARRAADQARLAARHAARPTVRFEYSPESFTGTELDFAKEICEAVMDVWQPTPDAQDHPQPARHRRDGDAQRLRRPDRVDAPQPHAAATRVVLSVHPHNDRGTGVAAAELAVMAGADRVEGTLFGNGERTGNVDMVTLALNLFSQGIDPELDFATSTRSARWSSTATSCPSTRAIPTPASWSSRRSPARTRTRSRRASPRAEGADVPWEVPYLPIDPADVGRSYEAVIRVNSQSGKGGVAYVLEQDFGYALPRELAVELSQHVQREPSARSARSRRPRSARSSSASTSIAHAPARARPPQLTQRRQRRAPRDRARDRRRAHDLSGNGSGPIDAFVRARQRRRRPQLQPRQLQRARPRPGQDARAVAYVDVTRRRAASAALASASTPAS